MTDLSCDEQQNLSRFIQLFIQIFLHGFDEIDMQQRLEFVRLLGSTADLWLNKTYGRISVLEQRVQDLEQQRKKK